MNVEQKLRELLCTEKPLAFLVGAGISIPSPSNLMSGTAFMERIIRMIAADEESKNILLYLSNSERYNKQNTGDFLRFEGLMQILQDSVDPNLNILDCLGDCNVPNMYHYVLAFLISQGHSVLTTNFDTLIELACQKLGVDYYAFITDNDFKKYFHDKHPYPLFKLHGSLKKIEGKEWVDSKYSIKATLNSVGRSGEQMQFEPGKKHVLNLILQNLDLVVIGYSGYDDFDIGPMLSTIRSDKKIIWINYNNELEIYHTWHDLENAPRDQNGDFLRKREKYLHAIGSPSTKNSVRNSDNVFLFDYDTSKLIEILREKYGIKTPKIEENYDFDYEKFFCEWESKNLLTDWLKNNITGRAFKSLQLNDHALMYFERSLAICEKSLYFDGVGLNLIEISDFHISKGEYKPALELLKKFIGIMGIFSDKTIRSSIWHRLGRIYQDMGEDEGALKFYMKSLDINAGIGNKSGVATTLQNMGMLYLKREEYEKAMGKFQKALPINEALGDIKSIAFNLHAMGMTYQCTENFEKALEYHYRSFDIREELGDLKGMSESLHVIGAIYQIAYGDCKLALRYYLDSLYLDESLGNKLGIAITSAQISVLYMEQKDYKFALKYLYRAHIIFIELKSPSSEKTEFNLEYIKERIGENLFDKYLSEMNFDSSVTK